MKEIKNQETAELKEQKTDDNLIENNENLQTEIKAEGGDCCCEVNKSEDISQILDKEAFEAKIKKSKELIKKDKSPQKKLWSFIFVVLNVVIVVAILLGLLNQDNYTPLTGISFNYWWLLVALGAFVVLMLIDKVRFYSLIKKATGMKRPHLAYKVGAVGKYYDFITPLATGGQPFQAYYLSTRGIKASHAVSIPVARYIVQQIVFSIFSVVMLILAYTGFKDLIPFDAENTSIVLIASWIGFALNALLVGLVIFLSIGSFGKKMVLGILKFLHKIKLVKNYDEKYAKILDIVEEYQRTFSFFVKSPLLLIEMVVFSFLYFFVQFSVPFFIYCAFGFEPTVESWITCLCVSLFVELAQSFIPLPGGSGVAELSFTTMFMTSFAGASFWALLFWRLITYYGFIIQGLVLIIYDAVFGNKKNKKHLQFLKEKYPCYYAVKHDDLTDEVDYKPIDEIEIEDITENQNKHR